MFHSSTNAYMLMYRKQRAGSDTQFVEFREMPPHICKLAKEIKNYEEMEKKRKEIERNSCKVSDSFLCVLKLRFKGVCLTSIIEAVVFGKILLLLTMSLVN